MSTGPRRVSTDGTITSAPAECQREVLLTVYPSGYFGVPRVSNGQAVTELLGGPPSAFSEYLRTARRRPCETPFEVESAAVLPDPLDTMYRLTLV